MVSDVSINTALAQQQTTTNAGSQLAQDFTQFLTLLTVQLQNQDPLSPMDTTEFTNQLVAFSGVEQQINTNQKLDSLVAMSLNNSFSSALGYVGLDVSYLSSEFTFDGTTSTKISYALETEAVSGKIRIKDETGNVVYTAEADKGAGVHEFNWDGSLTNGGTAEAGTYTVSIDTLDAEDAAVKTTIVVSGRVRGVETQNGQLFVLVGERAVPVANILNAIQPGTEPQEEEEA